MKTPAERKLSDVIITGLCSSIFIIAIIYFAIQFVIDWFTNLGQ
jgi:hypothetical protein